MNADAVIQAGAKLRTARQSKGLSVEDVALQMKLQPRYVVALEAGDLSALPEQTFVRGYVKTYARLVDLDAEVLLGAFAPVEIRAPIPLPDLGRQPGAVKVNRRHPRTSTFRSGARHRHWFAAGLLAIVAGGWAVWLGRDESARGVVTDVLAVLSSANMSAVTGDKSALTTEVPLPAVSPTAVDVVEQAAGLSATASATESIPVSASASTSGTDTSAGMASPEILDVPSQGLYLVFRGTSWVEVRDTDNAVLLTRLVPPDTTLTLDGKPPLTITLGDASGVTLWYNGEPVAINRFSRAGVARVIVGQPTR